MPPATVPAPPRRLFSAVFADAALGAAIDAERRRWVSLPPRLRPAPERLHLTLQFCPRAMPAQQAAWLSALAALRFAPFDIVLTHAERWRTPGGAIVVLRPAPSAALTALHQASQALAGQAGVPPEPRAWTPHVTVLRQADQVAPAPLAAPLPWRVRQVALVWSDLQAQPPRYHRLGEFPAR